MCVAAVAAAAAAATVQIVILLLRGTYTVVEMYRYGVFIVRRVCACLGRRKSKVEDDV